MSYRWNPDVWLLQLLCLAACLSLAVGCANRGSRNLRLETIPGPPLTESPLACRLEGLTDVATDERSLFVRLAASRDGDSVEFELVDVSVSGNATARVWSRARESYLLKITFSRQGAHSLLATVASSGSVAQCSTLLTAPEPEPEPVQETPVSQPPPAPVYSLLLLANNFATPIVVPPGEVVTISWNTTGLTECRLLSALFPFPLDVPPIAQLAVGPLANATAARIDHPFTLRCKDSSQTTRQVQNVVSVHPRPEGQISASYQGTPSPTAPVRVEWSASSYLTCEVTGREERSSGPSQQLDLGQGTSGNLTLGATGHPRPSPGVGARYFLRCQAGNARLEKEVALTAGVAPSGLSITANGQSGTYTRGTTGNVEIRWASRNATSCSVQPLGASALSGTIPVPVAQIAGTVTYTLRCDNVWGSSTASVVVRPPPCEPGTMRLLNGNPFNVTQINEKLTQKNQQAGILRSGEAYKFDQGTADALCRLFDYTRARAMECNAPQYHRCGWHSPGDNIFLVAQGQEWVRRNAKREGNRWLAWIECERVCQ